jgi:hypothetical protein
LRARRGNWKRRLEDALTVGVALALLTTITLLTVVRSPNLHDRGQRPTVRPITANIPRHGASSLRRTMRESAFSNNAVFER